MSAKQSIFRVRRNYNQWVNNQTLEDYALRFTAKKARKWSLLRVANTALGAISFLALEAIGGAITISYGFDNASFAILTVCLLIFLAGIPICYYAAKHGVDIDLLTRGAGFGYIGSTATSLIYASFTFIFFALEAAIMAMALKLLFGIPLSIGYVICSVIVIPLVTHGITLISRFQLWTQPLWVALQIIPFIYILFTDTSAIDEWQQFNGLINSSPGSISLVYFGAASAVLFSLVAQIGEQVDFLRFLPEKKPDNKWRWWCALILAGPGWVIIGGLKIFAGSLLAYMAYSQGIMSIEAADPSTMYYIAYERLLNDPKTALVVSGIFVILSQLKINVTNAYAGSIAWSNFFSRLTHNHPGRVVWLVFNVVIALLLMEIGVYQAFEQTLGAYAIVAVSWVSSLVADLIINKPLKLSPPQIEFRRAYLYDINPVGIGAMVGSSLIGICCYTGVFGENFAALAHFITIITAFVLSPFIAYITGGQFYIARPAELELFEAKTEVECCICQNHYETEDMAHCPAYEGPICSLCCSLDARCENQCKPVQRIPELIYNVLKPALPKVIHPYINGRIIHFLLLVVLVSAVLGTLLSIAYVNAQTGDFIIDNHMESLLWRVFLILLIVAGIASWLFVLAHESRKVAQEESLRQNQLLVKEIKAHEETDRELQRAKEQAEAANNAKSRYLTGISHELRTPLNSVLGYAQLLEIDSGIDESRRSKISVIKRSGEHLADLIEGLLDISKIEAGRLQIMRNQVRIEQLLNQLVFMFKLQAEEKGLGFKYECSPLPDFVTTDEKRLRQILINLLSNAIKFTIKGDVSFKVHYKNQVARFEIRDSGIGIKEVEIERIFKPFERIIKPGVPNTSGTGLGLTITKLLTEIMGGEIKVIPNPEGGTTFTVWLMLSDIVQPHVDTAPSRMIYGYKGKRKTVMVVDDAAEHRGLINDILSPLGFNIVEAPSGEDCLEMFNLCVPDLCLMDLQMPGKNGWEVSKILRDDGYRKPILMLSANANERLQTNQYPDTINDYLVKPLKIDTLLDKLEHWLELEWEYEPEAPTKIEKPREKTASVYDTLSEELREHLITLAEVGHLTELKKELNIIESKGLLDAAHISQLRTWLQEVRFDQILSTLRGANNEL